MSACATPTATANDGGGKSGLVQARFQCPVTMVEANGKQP